jgi:uncharacterized protein (TIGR00255 family)
MSGTGYAIRSMTGFGRETAEADGWRMEMELKGVNHRFLDIKMKIPSEIGFLEPELRRRIREVIARGRIDVVVTLAATRAPSYQVELNRALVKEYLRAAETLKEEFRLRGSIPLEAALALPGAVSMRAAADPGGESLARRTLAARAGALRAYDAMRKEEGARLAADLRGHLEAIAAEAEEIEGEARGLPEIYAARLRERVETLLRGQRGLDEVRLAQEVALLAGRVDLTEEIVRLKAYVAQARSTLDRPEGPAGKTLDFVMQEMNREANTLSSKAESMPICQAALRIKSAVEKIREQVQNLE